MKFTLILALPAIALAAATPPTVEKRQLPNLPDLDLPLNVPCLLEVANIRRCLPNVGSGATPIVGDLLQCLLRLPLVVVAALDCVDVPVKA
ncbi:hypothetical protein FVEN_g2752 [Fusarium venenatum]|uniref:Hydrophobin n=1 Tax=Fusarium venenatum TaxID=56646 RepID=A0A2L2TF92_9HYPO|nr:uncharacterized protein FVRRES_06122 [Fusarium venenatum]KAG8359253.1 hypothetical protein FVEN_g2752 [Fusarium venenatum]KAH6993146.1 hypothetical protein EDB82DRAFT_536163 [Fusarium venenatum]CEI61686.1 unnamed protein product [Fusarium venenatum]